MQQTTVPSDCYFRSPVDGHFPIFVSYILNVHYTFALVPPDKIYLLNVEMVGINFDGCRMYHSGMLPSRTCSSGYGF